MLETCHITGKKDKGEPESEDLLKRVSTAEKDAERARKTKVSVTKERLEWDIKDIETKKLGNVIVENAKEFMQEDIWIWWERLCEEKEGNRTWEIFKEKALEKYRNKERKLPPLLQNIGEQTKEWLERIEVLGNKIGASQKEIKYSMHFGLMTPILRRRTRDELVSERGVECFKEIVLEIDTEIRRRNAARNKFRDKREVKCYRCENLGHISKEYQTNTNQKSEKEDDTGLNPK